MGTLNAEFAEAFALPLSDVELIKEATSWEDYIRLLPRVELPVEHIFSEGIYARECFLKAGTLLTGKIHKRENLAIMSQGRVVVITNSGPLHVCAPFTIVSPPGTKRLIYVIEDAIWTCVHPTHERDLDKIEADFIAQDLEEYLAYKAAQLPGHEWDAFSYEELL